MKENLSNVFFIVRNFENKVIYSLQNKSNNTFVVDVKLDNFHGLSAHLDHGGVDDVHHFGAEQGRGSLGVSVLLLSLAAANHHLVGPEVCNVVARFDDCNVDVRSGPHVVDDASSYGITDKLLGAFLRHA